MLAELAGFAPPPTPGMAANAAQTCPSATNGVGPSQAVAAASIAEGRHTGVGSVPAAANLAAGDRMALGIAAAVRGTPGWRRRPTPPAAPPAAAAPLRLPPP